MVKASSLYSQSKPLWHLDSIEALRNGGLPTPVHVQLILSDLCNQDCHFCAYRMSGGLSTELFGEHNPNRKIETSKAIQIIDDCAAIGVKAIQFTGGGEPTVHKDLWPLISRAQNHGMKTGLVTNGVRLNTVKDLNWLRISVDAGTKELYCQVRNVSASHWTKLWANIGKLSAFNGNFGVGFVVTNENIDSLPELAKKCVNIPYIRVGAVFSTAGLGFYHDLDHILSVINTVKKKYPNIIDLFGRRLSDLEDGSPEQDFCGYQHFTTYIGADLNVYRCCNTAYTTIGSIGNLKNARFRDFYNDKPFDARECRYCQFQGQNRVINSLLTRPDDPDFV